MRWIKWLLGGFGLLVFSSLGVSMMLEPKSVGPAVAPKPTEQTEAVVQIYGADVWGIRGHFAIHTWLAVKPPHAATYDIYQVIGWLQRRGRSVVSVTQGLHDKPWFGSAPVLLHEVTGPAAQALIQPIRDSVARYPFAGEYTMWPGPNSNSFMQWIALEVPELGLQLPAKAIGKNWMQNHYPRYR